MKYFDDITYLQLLKEANKKAKLKGLFLDKDRLKFDNQYYQFYISLKCQSIKDLAIIAGLAYSWMPTKLDLYFPNDYNWQLLFSYIQSFKKNNLDIREELIFQLSTNCNHSIVGASKMLHFINPKFAPMVDSRVTRYWNRFFANEIRRGIVRKMPSTWNVNYNNEIAVRKKIEIYLYYWDCLLLWKKNMKNTLKLRDIEVLFYFLGDK